MGSHPLRRSVVMRVNSDMYNEEKKRGRELEFKHIISSNLWAQMAEAVSKIPAYQPERVHWDREVVRLAGMEEQQIHQYDHAYRLDAYIFTTDHMKMYGFDEILRNYRIHQRRDRTFEVMRLEPLVAAESMKSSYEKAVTMQTIVRGEGKTPLQAIIDLHVKQALDEMRLKNERK